MLFDPFQLFYSSLYMVFWLLNKTFQKIPQKKKSHRGLELFKGE